MNPTRTTRRFMLLPLTLLALFGCADPLTELVVVISSDVPQADFEKVDVLVTGPTGAMVLGSTNDFREPNASDLPLSIGLVLEGPTLSPLTVEVTGTLRDGSVIAFEIDTGFVPLETRVIEAHLYGACADLGCDGRCVADPAGTTECRTRSVESETLPEYTGDVRDHLIPPPG